MMAVLSVASFALTAYVDLATGYEFLLTAAYLVPVAFCAWHFGRTAVISMSVACGLAVYFGDPVATKPGASPLERYGNGLLCLAIYLMIGLIVIRLRKALVRQKKANEELERALDELRRATEEMRRLQDTSQVICAWTKQIKVGEEWMTAEEFLSTRLHIKLSHGISPEALREIERSVGEVMKESPPALEVPAPGGTAKPAEAMPVSGGSIS
jgi:K+-sensing histidine kinase KdpD